MVIGIFIFWAVGLFLIAMLFQGVLVKQHTLGRLFNQAESEESAPSVRREVPFISKWLRRAGFQKQIASFYFLAGTSICSLLGYLVSHTLLTLKTFDQLIELFITLPGEVGNLFVPILYAGPILLGLFIALSPSLYVRSHRLKRVEGIEKDLPVVLELLATLGESGMGFDEALSRVVQSLGLNRPLTQELRLFQNETMSGQPRVRSFWRLANDINLPSVRVVASALVQAEQSGGHMSAVLRRQAEESLSKRRFRAMQLTNSLPVQLLIPMVVCFLPAIFVVMLGPTAYYFWNFFNSFLNFG